MPEMAKWGFLSKLKKEKLKKGGEKKEKNMTTHAKFLPDTARLGSARLGAADHEDF